MSKKYYVSMHCVICTVHSFKPWHLNFEINDGNASERQKIAKSKSTSGRYVHSIFKNNRFIHDTLLNRYLWLQKLHVSTHRQPLKLYRVQLVNSTKSWRAAIFQTATRSHKTLTPHSVLLYYLFSLWRCRTLVNWSFSCVRLCIFVSISLGFIYQRCQ